MHNGETGKVYANLRTRPRGSFGGPIPLLVLPNPRRRFRKVLSSGSCRRGRKHDRPLASSTSRLTSAPVKSPVSSITWPASKFFNSEGRLAVSFSSILARAAASGSFLSSHIFTRPHRTNAGADSRLMSPSHRDRESRLRQPLRNSGKRFLPFVPDFSGGTNCGHLLRRRICDEIVRNAWLSWARPDE